MPKAKHWAIAALIFTLVTTPALAETDVHTSNESEDVNTESGEAHGENNESGFVGHSDGEGETSVGTSDIDDSEGRNVQEGDNSADGSQTLDLDSGGSIGGQVVGAINREGDLNIDAINLAENVDSFSGDVDGSNDAANFVGLAIATDTTVAADLDSIIADNIQEGRNDGDFTQAVDGTSGDSVGGQLIGAVGKDPAGDVNVAAANKSDEVNVGTGDVDADNSMAAFVGLDFSTETLAILANISDVTGSNVQEGDNDFSGDQSARAHTGDGVGGQAVGVSSAGGATVDAANESNDVDVVTGTGAATNDAASFIGLAVVTETSITSDLTSITGTNVQEGSNDSGMSQLADAMSGDAVSGQMVAVGTGNGDADVTVSNIVDGSSTVSGDASMNNDESIFTGLTRQTGSVVLSDLPGPIDSVLAFASS